jgi:DNA-binding NarL/FixJ family response regulator
MTLDTDNRKKGVFIVDDHPLVREWLATLINQQSDLQVWGEAGSAPEGLELIASTRPHAAVLDISMPGGSGIELIKNIKAVCPEVEVLVFSMHDESLYRERAFRAGARGYIRKREAPQDVLQAVRSVLEGKFYHKENTAEAMAGKFVGVKTPATDSLVEQLSDRELEVFHLLGRGFGLRQMAEELHVNVTTIRTYCARLKEKLKLSSAHELMREATSWHDRQSRK